MLPTTVTEREQGITLGMLQSLQHWYIGTYTGKENTCLQRLCLCKEMRVFLTTFTSSRFMLFTVNSNQILETKDRRLVFDALQHRTFTCSHVTALWTPPLLTYLPSCSRVSGTEPQGNALSFEKELFPNSWFCSRLTIRASLHKLCQYGHTSKP